jgi:Zn finger protein HypA/HybF involved in hydrogenase expression
MGATNGDMKNTLNTDIYLIQKIFNLAKKYGCSFKDYLEVLEYDFAEFHCQSCGKQLNEWGRYTYELTETCRVCESKETKPLTSKYETT